MRFLKLPVVALLVSAQASSVSFGADIGQADPYRQHQTELAIEKNANEASLYAIGTSLVLFVAANSAKADATQFQNLIAELRRVKALNERVQQVKMIKKDTARFTVREVGLLVGLENDLRQDRVRAVTRVLNNSEFLTPNSLHSTKFESTVQDLQDRQAKASKLKRLYFKSGLPFGFTFVAGQVVVRMSSTLAATFLRFRSTAAAGDVSDADVERVAEALGEMADLFETI